MLGNELTAFAMQWSTERTETESIVFDSSPPTVSATCGLAKTMEVGAVQEKRKLKQNVMMIASCEASPTELNVKRRKCPMSCTHATIWLHKTE